MSGNDKPTLTRELREAVQSIGEPETLNLDGQHNAVLQHLFQTLELCRLGGFDVRSISTAAAAATVSFTANLSQVERNEIAQSLRKCADEIQTTDADDVTEH